MKKWIGILSIFICVNALAVPKYKDSSVPIEERVEDLLQRMTLEEKVAQLQRYFVRDSVNLDPEGNIIGIKDTLIARGAGSIGVRRLWQTSSPREQAQWANAIQKYMLEKTRLGIPVFIFGESLHGFMANGATSFPQAIALGCSWDTLLVEQVYTAAALEARSRGTTQVLSPVLDLARDPRWGRTEECFGEDPYLVSRMGMAAVFGFQGRGKTIDLYHVASTLKHFAGHGQPEGGRNIAPVNYSEREFRENHLYPFEMAVTKAHARSIMASYNEWDGIPNHVNKKLLMDILRGEWGFDGFVMSDGGGMDVTYEVHRAAKDAKESGALSIEAGLDYDLSSRGCFRSLVEQVKAGEVSQQAIDRAVRNILRVKFECGLFDNPYVDVDFMERITRCEAHRALALKAAHEAIVLLKNENSILPLDSTKIRTLAVIGPNAVGIHLGGYSPVPMEGVDVLEGIKAFAKNRFRVLYAEGCKLTVNKEWHWRVNENPLLGDSKENARLIKEAVKIAQKSDAVILALGENELICREAWSEDHLGDRDDLVLVGDQMALAEAILKLGKPTVVLLFNGRPLAIPELVEKAPVIIECWYLGEETGHAVADVIFGKVNPSGKLTVTIPRSVGQLPCYYNYKGSRFREYVLSNSKPLFPFGFGLSYTTFEYSNLKITPKTVNSTQSAEVTIDVQNTGTRSGDEIVQLYIRALSSLPTRPVQELKDFARISLAPGETKTVRFLLTLDKFAIFGMDMKRFVPKGEYEIRVGKNCLEVLTDTVRVE